MDYTSTMLALVGALVSTIMTIVVVRAWLRTAHAAEAIVAEGDRLRELMQEHLAATKKQNEWLAKIAANTKPPKQPKGK